jgi:uncharacterized Zn finger protein (UPF0148 family)
MRQIYVIDIHCSKCKTKLYKYRKEGPGNLQKCYVDGITEDNTKGDMKCPKCDTEFARAATVHNRPVHKIIRGKVFVKGHHG